MVLAIPLKLLFRTAFQDTAGIHVPPFQSLFVFSAASDAVWSSLSILTHSLTLRLCYKTLLRFSSTSLESYLTLCLVFLFYVSYILIFLKVLPEVPFSSLHTFPNLYQQLLSSQWIAIIGIFQLLTSHLNLARHIDPMAPLIPSFEYLISTQNYILKKWNVHTSSKSAFSGSVQYFRAH